MTTLLLDGNFLAHRAHHTTGELEYKGKLTGVAYGVLRDVAILHEMFDVDYTVWAFDAPRRTTFRKRDYEEYKANREGELLPEEQVKLFKFHAQLDELRETILPALGYRNVFRIHGYEGDDVLAAVVKKAPTSERCVIVSADKDLLQCVRGHIHFYNPIKGDLITLDVFRERYGIHPTDWIEVKSMTGDAGDNIKGLKGIGEKTALKFVTGTLKKGMKYQQIVDGVDIIERNIKLVRLPYPGIEVPELKPDKLSASKRSSVESELGIRPKRVGVVQRRRKRAGFDV